MRVAISATGDSLESGVDAVFGRCATFLCVDTETLEAAAWPNPALGASGGAGIQAAQFVLGQGVEAVVSGNLGPNAAQVFAAAGVPVYEVSGGTVRQAVEALRSGTLTPVNGPTVGKDHGKPAGGLGRGHTAGR